MNRRPRIRFCRKCADAYEACPPNAQALMVAVIETGQWVCQFGKPECGRFVDYEGKVLALSLLVKQCQ